MRINASKFALLISSLSTGLMLPVSNRRSGGCSDGLKLAANCSGNVLEYNQSLLQPLIDNQCVSGGCLQGHCPLNFKTCLSSTVNISVCIQDFPEVFNTICSSSQVDATLFWSSSLAPSSTASQELSSTPSQELPSTPSQKLPSTPAQELPSTPFPSSPMSPSSAPPQKPLSTPPQEQPSSNETNTDKDITSNSSNPATEWIETSPPFKPECSPSPSGYGGDRNISIQSEDGAAQQQWNPLFFLLFSAILGVPFLMDSYDKNNKSVIDLKQQLRELLDKSDGDDTNDAALLDEVFKKLSQVSVSAEIVDSRALDGSVGNNSILQNLTQENTNLFNASKQKWFKTTRFLPILNLVHFHMVVEVLDCFFKGSFFDFCEKNKVEAAVKKHLSSLQDIQTSKIIEIENFGEKLFDAVNDFFDGIIREFDSNQEFNDNKKRLEAIKEHKESFLKCSAKRFVDQLKFSLGVDDRVDDQDSSNEYIGVTGFA